MSFARSSAALMSLVLMQTALSFFSARFTLIAFASLVLNLTICSSRATASAS
ncbi:hypothetical protein PC118_g25979 [Phytophthora cactorum]|uniref:Uncharacterized protein n=1 Tax=Phytophthora cactorum TaxID=29920 RepID=A0A8T1DHX2_9STRA|nr:hypothetical protein PC118_g25979 [Phytophthora cactorum]